VTNRVSVARRLSATASRPVWIVGCGLVLAASAAASAAAAPGASSAGTIVFSADRAPTLVNEVFAVGADGRRVDLSRSFARDTGPSVSPNGKLVAFASNRGPGVAVYVVGIDGTHLRRVSPFLYRGDRGQGVEAQIAWRRGSMEIAAAVSGYGDVSALWVGDLGGHGRVVTRASAQDPAWSPSGELAFAVPDPSYDVRVLSPAGKQLWTAPWVSQVAPAWSSSNRLAVESKGVVSVRDSSGRRLFAFRGVQLAWSPNGKELASVYEHRLSVRAGGIGKPIVDAPIGYSQAIQWMSNGTLRSNDGSRWVGYDVAHGRPLTLSSADAAFDDPSIVSGSGSLAYGTRSAALDQPDTLYLDGTAIATAMACGDDTPFGSLQFVPGEREVVYDGTDCLPSGDLYSIGGNGAGLRRITNTAGDETAPSASPDGSEIAFVHELAAEGCQGCPTTIWTVGGDGSDLGERTPELQDFWDASPSFSPDGTTIVFSHSPIEGASKLIEIPAAGGDEKVLPVDGVDPSWGPTRIAYTTSTSDVRTALPDGTGVKTVAHDPHIENSSLAWSRDGRLAYVDGSDDGALTLVVAGKRYPLAGVHATYLGIGLAWSPDGKTIALDGADDAGVSDIWTIGADGMNLTRLTHGLGVGGRLSWIQSGA
jgi:Tol biopolymer transport system component